MPQSDGTAPVWGRRHWFVAALLPGTLFVLEAAKLSLFEVTRAPNVSLPLQSLAMLGFFASWLAVPRIMWWVFDRHQTERRPFEPWLLPALLLTGLILALLHLSLLAGLLRWMHSPPGWGLTHYLQSLAEVLLADGGAWLMAYGLVAGLMTWVRRPVASESLISGPEAPRLEVRHRGRLYSLGPEDIYWLQADGNYVTLHTRHGRMMSRSTLGAYRNRLAPAGFIQSHRGALINPTHLIAILPQRPGSGYLAELRNGDRAPLSRRQLAAVRDRLQHISSS